MPCVPAANVSQVCTSAAAQLPNSAAAGPAAMPAHHITLHMQSVLRADTKPFINAAGQPNLLLLFFCCHSWYAECAAG
jgi:hypothetical protein